MDVHLGFEVGSGDPVAIPMGHLVVFGMTQEAGKTTTLEALISRADVPAVAFVTKRGEGGFSGGRHLVPYFRERADWQFVQAVLEATLQAKQDFKQAWIMRACEGARSLAGVHKNVRRLMKDAKGLSLDMYYVLDHYFELVIPQIERLPKADKVELAQGLNVMALDGYSPELQALVIRSVIEWIHKHEHGVVTVIPEAWRFLPQSRRSPVRMAAEELVREGATLKNFVWIDSQDIAGVDKLPLRAAKTWLIGVQREPNELERNLKAIPAGIQKPRLAEVAGLGLGQFFACWKDRVVKVYVQPAWMDEEDARAIARGREAAEQIPRPAPQITPQDEEIMPSELEAKLDRLTQVLERLVETGHRPADRVPRERSPFDTNNSRPAAVPLPPDEESLYQRIKARLLSEDDPAVLRVLTQRPELQVAVEREVVEVSDKSPEGRIGKLIAEGFFKNPISDKEVWLEMKRRGWLAHKAPRVKAYQACTVMLKKGFLTKDDGLYQAVPGMKVNLVESKAHGH